jgi:hypothetical protein
MILDNSGSVVEEGRFGRVAVFVPEPILKMGGFAKARVDDDA